MESIEILIPDKEGNHLVVALSFYDNMMKTGTLQIPEELAVLDIADISIAKLDINKPLNIRAFFQMCEWLISQFTIFPNAVFSFICSTDSLVTNHKEISSEQYRWRLLECLYKRNIQKLHNYGIESKDVVVGPEGFQTFARVFYRVKHSPVIHLVISHLNNKYPQ